MKRIFFIFFIISSLAPIATCGAVAPVTLTDKIDQLIMIGFRGTTITPTSDINTILSNSNIGGVILFDYDSGTKTYGRNITTAPQVRTLTTSLQAKARTPLLIAIDEEGGLVSRLKKIPGFTPLPSARVLGTLPYTSVFAQSRNLAAFIKSLGVNVNFAPVLDLTSTNPAAPMTKHARTFSSIPSIVAAYAQQFILGMNTSGIVSAGKHFPGLGDATIDTHKGSATITTHDDRALLPYKILAQSNALPMVMVSHVTDTSVDPLLPASLSPAHMRVLRDTVGFSGVVITDDLDMGAIKGTYGTGAATVRAIAAGADMVILSNNIDSYNPQAFYEARNALQSAVEHGTLSETQITDSYNRVQTLKKNYGIIK